MQGKAHELEVNMGPQHPATHGVLRLQLRLDGETITNVRPVIGYLHRGVEKLAETRAYPSITPYTDRLDYCAAFAENHSYVGAVEKLIGIPAPPRAQYMRVVLAELQRIASHLLWLATHALDIGAMTVFIYTFREREKVLDLFESYCGARLTYNATRIGGMPFEFPDGWTDAARLFLAELPGRVAQYETLLTENRIWRERTEGIGVIDAATALAHGMTGPSLRGSGIDYDLRKVAPYECYADLDFDVPVGGRGDTYDRYLVRMEEMRQSRRIVLQALEKLPDGPIQAKVPKRIKPAKGAEAYFASESPRGEMSVYLISDGNEKPYRVRFRSPCFNNLHALPTLAQGHMVADVVALIGTIDIVLGCVDR
jgi:NADH-quinone oxidoreductase subunit D